VARPQGGWPLVVFYPFGHPTPHAHAHAHATCPSYSQLKMRMKNGLDGSKKRENNLTDFLKDKILNS